MLSSNLKRKISISKKPLQTNSIVDIERRLRKDSKLDTFYFDFFFPAIPVGILKNCKANDLALYLRNIVHLVEKKFTSEKSILDISLAYKNIGLSQVEKSTTKRRHK